MSDGCEGLRGLTRVGEGRGVVRGVARAGDHRLSCRLAPKPSGSAGLGGCLFNLSADPEERRDLAADRPDLVASLAARLAALAATRIDKSHGDVDPAGCYQAIENGNFWGPFLP